MDNSIVIKNAGKENKSLMKTALVFMMYLLVLGQIYAYNGMPYTTSTKSFVFEQIASTDKITVAVSLFSTLCILAMFFSNRIPTVPSYVMVGGILLIGVCQWTFATVIDFGINTTFYTSTPPFAYITALIFCVGFDDDLFETFLKHARIIGVFSLVLCFISSIMFFETHPDSIFADCSNLRYYIQSFWLLCICSFCEEKTNKVFNYLIIVTLAGMSLFFSSRSWLIQCAIWMVLYTFYSNKQKNFFSTMKKVFLVCLVTIIIVFVLVNVFPDFLDILINKKSPVDTRAGQYKDIFEQTNFWQFIFGSGYGFSYYSSIQGKIYNYIDNAYILMLLRYGIIIGFSYTLMFVIPLFKSKFARQSMPILLWLFALGGLSIFNATILDIKSIALPVVAGRCMYLSTKNK